MKTLVVGGNFDSSGGKKSGIVTKLAEALGAEVINGGPLDDLRSINLAGFRLVIWMPNIANNEDKFYPKKDIGAVLICSKIMRSGYTHWDSGTRIFRMNANAVIEIYVDSLVRFMLIDALNNVWVEETHDIEKLADGIKQLEAWTNSSLRVASISCLTECPPVPEDLASFVQMIRIVANKVTTENGPRYFGNASTRCMKTFP